MSYTDRSASWRTSTLHCRSCAPRSTGGGCTQCPPGPTGATGPRGFDGATGPTGPTASIATWSQFAATRDVSFGCFLLNDVSGINFCDGSYIGHGASLDIIGSSDIDMRTNNQDITIQRYDGAGIIPDTRVILEASGNMRITGQGPNDGRFIQTSTRPYTLSLYVSKSGNDISGTGSESNPFLTIQKAITVAEALSTSTNPYELPTIYVDAGLYLEKLTITKNLTIIGINQYLANNLASYGGQHSTRIGDNAGTNFVDIRSAVANHTVRFENLDFRCRISNMEAGVPTNAVSLYMDYCNINRPSEAFPILYIGGVSVSTLSNVYMSNVRSNGTCTHPSLAVYEFPDTNFYMEECRWNGVPSAVGIMRLTRAVVILNCELRYGATTSPIATTNLPLIVLNFGGGQTARFVNTTLTIEYGASKTAGANLITIPNSAPFSSTPHIQIDDCYMLFRTASASNYILQNLSGKNISLQFHRVSSMSVAGGNSVIDYTNISVTDASTVIASRNNFTSGRATATIELAAIGGTKGELRADDTEGALVLDASSSDVLIQTNASAYMKSTNNTGTVLLQVDGDGEAVLGGGQFQVSSAIGNGILRVQAQGGKGGEITADESAGNFVIAGKNGFGTAIENASYVGISATDLTSDIGITVGSGESQINMNADGAGNGTLTLITNYPSGGSEIKMALDGFGNKEIAMTTDGGAHQLRQTATATEIVGDSSVYGPTLRFVDPAMTIPTVDMATRIDGYGFGNSEVALTAGVLSTSTGAIEGVAIGTNGTNNIVMGNGLPLKVSKSFAEFSSDYIELATNVGGTCSIIQTEKITLDTPELAIDNVPDISGSGATVTLEANSTHIIKNWLKVTYNGNPIWIPYLTSDPST